MLLFTKIIFSKRILSNTCLNFTPEILLIRYFTIVKPKLINAYSTEKLKDGFECPPGQQVDALGQIVAHPKFAHPSDCQRFYVCLNGVEPRDLGCQVGEVYNEETQKCDAPENVRGW